MRCEDALPLIDAIVVGELLPDASAALEAHLASCPRCLARARDTRRLLELLSELPPVPLADGFTERVLAAAVAERDARRVHRPWVATLRMQIFHGVVRTTGTLVATLAVVALLGGALVFAASNFFTGTPFQVLTHTPTPSPAASAPAGTVTVPASTAPATPLVTPPSIVATPAPTPTSAPPTATPVQTPVPTPTATTGGTPTPTPVVTPEPTPVVTPTPTATPKERRCPPGEPCGSPSPNPDLTSITPPVAALTAAPQSAAPMPSP